jgi:soluble lytic murein transglycosylase-like protein
MALIIIAAVGLLLLTIHLENQRREFKDRIAYLEESVDILNNRVSLLQSEVRKSDFYSYMENMFRLEYPAYSKVVDIVYKKSKAYNFNPYLVMAIIQVESEFNPFAVSHAGAYGLMQINYAVWKNKLNIDFQKIFDIEYNIDLGLRILKQYYEEAGKDILLALHLYNNGYKYNNTEYSGKVVSTIFYPKKGQAIGTKN